MSPSIQAALVKSDSAFLAAVGPALVARHQGVELMPVRDFAGNPRVLHALDVQSGIDFIVRRKDGLVPIAARVQYAKRPYESFTVRINRNGSGDLEWTSRMRAFVESQENLLAPAFVVQAYVDPGDNHRCLGAYQVQNDALISAVIDPVNIHRWSIRKNSHDDTVFLIAWVSQLRSIGVTVDEIHPPARVPVRGVPVSESIALPSLPGFHRAMFAA